MNELFNVKDKVVVITGGAGILGKGIAAYLAKEGAKVVVLDRSEEAGKALVGSYVPVYGRNGQRSAGR